MNDSAELMAEIERLRKAMYFAPSIFSLVSKELLTEKETEIARLRGLLREAVAIIDGISPYTLGGWAKRIREALGNE